MRGRSEASLLCRYAVRPSSQFAPSHRTASSRAGDLKTFNASRLILDLEAADSSFVRLIEGKDFKLVSNNKTGQIKGAKAKRIDAIDDSQLHLDDQKIDVTTAGKKIRLEAQRPRGADFFLLALSSRPIQLGGEDASEEMQRKFEHAENAAADWDDQVETFEESLTWMQDRFQQPKASLDATNLETESVVESVVAKIKECTDLETLMRFTATIAESTVGCRLLISQSKVIVEAIKQLHSEQKVGTKSTAILKFINNLAANIEHKGVNIGPVLSDAGLFYARGLGIVPAIERYTNMADNNETTKTP